MSNLPTRRAMIAYALPALPLAALYFPVYVYIAPFYAGQRAVPLALLGTLFVVVRLIDAFSDPLMGWISDRTSERLGRRKFWLAVSVPLVAVSVWQLMVPPPDADFAYVATWMTALTLAWTVALTPWYAWGAEMTGDYVGRASVAAWREGTTLVGTVVAVILYNVSDGPAEGLATIALFVAIAMPLTALVALRFSPEPQNFSRTRLKPAAAIAALRDNAPFRRLIAAYFINGSANALPAGLFLFFIEDYLGAPEAGWLLLVYFVCAIAGMPIWSTLARYYPKHRVWGGAMVYACVVFAFVPLLRPGDLTAFLVICVLTGLALSADLALPSAIQADVVDVDTARHGEQRTGLFFALWSVATKAALAVAGGAALIVLDSAGFVAGGDNPPEALRTLALLYAAVPVVLKLLAVAMMWGFPIDRAEHDRLRLRIEA